MVSASMAVHVGHVRAAMSRGAGLKLTHYRPAPGRPSARRRLRGRRRQPAPPPVPRAGAGHGPLRGDRRRRRRGAAWLAQALNAIYGADDLGRKAALVRDLLAALPAEEVAAILPESIDALQGLARLGAEPGSLAENIRAWAAAQGVRLERVSFPLTPEQREVIEAAITRALPGLPSGEAPNRRALALVTICQAWLAHGMASACRRGHPISLWCHLERHHRLMGWPRHDPRAIACPICGTAMRVTVTTNRNGKHAIGVHCPDDGRHFRGFINHRPYVEAVLGQVLEVSAGLGRTGRPPWQPQRSPQRPLHRFLRPQPGQRPRAGDREQLRQLQAWAARRGLEVVRVYRVEESAWKGRHRSQLDQVLADARRGDFQGPALLGARSPVPRGAAGDPPAGGSARPLRGGGGLPPGALDRGDRASCASCSWPSSPGSPARSGPAGASGPRRGWPGREPRGGGSAVPQEPRTAAGGGAPATSGAGLIATPDRPSKQSPPPHPLAAISPRGLARPGKQPVDCLCSLSSGRCSGHGIASACRPGVETGARSETPDRIRQPCRQSQDVVRVLLPQPSRDWAGERHSHGQRILTAARTCQIRGEAAPCTRCETAGVCQTEHGRCPGDFPRAVSAAEDRLQRRWPSPGGPLDPISRPLSAQCCSDRLRRRSDR